MGGRQRDIAAALGGEPAIFYPLGDGTRLRLLLRYLSSLVLTAGYLLRRRPRAVIVSNPPMFAALPALLYARLARVPMLLDSHPGGFGLQGDRLSARLQPLHRLLVRNATATLVTQGSLVDQVSAWEGRAEILHEAPPAWKPPEPRPAADPFTVLFVCIFQPDEPASLVTAAARLLPDVRVQITGDLARAPAGLVEEAPANVEFTGLLGPEDYRGALFAADAVLVITTESTSVVRAGYEAVWAHRPLVVSDWPELRRVFPEAVHTATDSRAIARAIETARARHGELAAAAPAARARQLGRWQDQLSALERAIGATV